MKQILIAALGLMLLVNFAAAQNQIPERLLLTRGEYVGSGARALGMAGTYTGIADDYSSVWWNPAGLAQIKRIEMQGSLSRTGFTNKGDYYGASRDGSTSGIRLNNLGIVFPVPVYRGAMTFAFGYNQLVSYDRRTRVTAPGPGAPDYAAWQADLQSWNNFDELENGRLGVWTFSGAMDVSENLALGASINYYSGVDDYSLTGTFPSTDSSGHGFSQYTETTINTDISGWGLGLGGMYRVGRFARVGLMFQTPVNMKLNEDHTFDGNSGFFDYRMSNPAIFRAGVSFSPGRWLLGADVEYRDWTTMQFTTDTPYLGVSEADGNQQIKNTYQSTTRISFGGEYLFPAYGLRARAGYAFEPTSFATLGSNDNRNIIGLGLGVLVDKSVMLDIGYQFTNFKQNFTPGLTEKINTNNALVTVSYRM